VENKNGRIRHVKRYWEMIADRLSKAGWSWGCVATVDSSGRTIRIADAHRDNGNRFVARSDEKLTAFLEVERVTRESLRFLKGRTNFEFEAVQAQTVESYLALGRIIGGHAPR
jgi:hypothetical protein